VTVTGHRSYAGAVSRAIAFAVDAALVTAAGTAGVLATAMVAVLLFGRDPGASLGTVLGVTLPALLTLYHAAFWALAGRTPGMALVGLRVLTTAGAPVGGPRAFGRAVALSVFPAGALWCLVDRRRQAVHDKLARTVVVRALGGTPAQRA
jgi:uncharacterized RDD family membrane protein YckC